MLTFDCVEYAAVQRLAIGITVGGADACPTAVCQCVPAVAIPQSATEGHTLNISPTAMFITYITDSLKIYIADTADVLLNPLLAILKIIYLIKPKGMHVKMTKVNIKVTLYRPVKKSSEQAPEKDFVLDPSTQVAIHQLPTCHEHTRAFHNPSNKETMRFQLSKHAILLSQLTSFF